MSMRKTKKILRSFQSFSTLYRLYPLSLVLYSSYAWKNFLRWITLTFHYDNLSVSQRLNETLTRKNDPQVFLHHVEKNTTPFFDDIGNNKTYLIELID